jgi:hypothetical protein
VGSRCRVEMSQENIVFLLSEEGARPFYILNRTKKKRIRRKQLKKLEELTNDTFSYFEDEEGMYYADGK